jgi:tetratricopeptide (TPR) repeat protein
MLRKEMTKLDIEKELNGQGDYVQIDNITRFVKDNPPIDIKRFVYLKLAGIYERRNMFADAAEIYMKLIEISLVEKDKVNYLTKATENYIKAGFFDKADATLKKALSEASVLERGKISISIKEFYKTQAQLYEKEKRRQKAIQTYEKMLSMNYSDYEKKEIAQKLLVLYKELGMVEQYMILNKKING